MNISKKQYFILKKLYKSKDKILMNTETPDYKFLLYFGLIESNFNNDGPFPTLKPNGETTITNNGIDIYNAYALETKRHWQKMFIPQTLNILVSMITTVITYFILEFLKSR